MKLIASFFSVLLLTCTLQAQSKNIYLFKDKYSIYVQNFIEKSNEFRTIKILNNNQLLLNNKIDYLKIEDNLNKIFPDINSEGVLCLDLENEFYDQIKGYTITRFKKPSLSQFKVAENQYIDLIRFVKNKRPNIKIGLYGMPAKIYTESEERSGTQNALDNILKESDIIMPSLYMPYPQESNGYVLNYSYLKINLDNAFEYGKRLNKPVLPFFWYFFFSPNNEYTYEIIPKQEMNNYLNYIFNYKYDNLNVIGIIWWETATPFYKKNKGLIKQNFINPPFQENEITQTNLFYYYFN